MAANDDVDFGLGESCSQYDLSCVDVSCSWREGRLPLLYQTQAASSQDGDGEVALSGRHGVPTVGHNQALHPIAERGPGRVEWKHGLPLVLGPLLSEEPLDEDAAPVGGVNDSTVYGGQTGGRVGMVRPAAPQLRSTEGTRAVYGAQAAGRAVKVVTLTVPRVAGRLIEVVTRHHEAVAEQREQ